MLCAAKGVEIIMAYDPGLVSKLLEKSIEAFLMAIEIYNKPSIHYRVEGFSFLYAMHGSLC